MEKKPTYTQTFGQLAPPKPKKGEGQGWFASLLKGGQSWTARADSPQEAPLLEMVTRLCPKMGIDIPPEVIIYHSPYPNAASTITGKVMVSDNLLQIMTPEQVEGVMGHELAHHRHKSRDNFVMFGGTIAADYAYQKTFAAKLWKAIGSIKNVYARTAAYIATPVTEFLAVIGVINLYQQKAEYESDRESAEVTGKPKVMAEALNTLDKRMTEIHTEARKKSRGKMSDTGKVIADTIERLEPRWVRRIRHNPFEVFGSHPPIKLRVEALEAQEARMHSEEKAPQRLS
jgi:heat shock protein HtpX